MTYIPEPDGSPEARPEPDYYPEPLPVPDDPNYSWECAA